MTYIDSPIPNPAKFLGNNDKNTILFINRKVLGARKLLLKHIYLILFNQFRPYLELFEKTYCQKLVYDAFPWTLHQHLKYSSKKWNDRQGRE